MSTCFFPFTFSTVTASHHTTFVSQFRLSSVMMSYGYVAIKGKYYSLIFVYGESQSHRASEQHSRCTVLTARNSHTQKALFGCVTLIT